MEEPELDCTAGATEAKGGSTRSGDCLEVSAHADHHELAHLEAHTTQHDHTCEHPGPHGWD